MENLPKKFKLIVWVAALAVLAVLILSWAGSHGRLTIDLRSVRGYTGKTTFTFVDREGKSSVKSSGSGHFSAFFPVGDFTVYAQQGDTTYFSTLHTNSFLRKTILAGSFHQEAKREVVGSNPAPCMFYVGDKLLSTECNESLYGLVEHIPATSEMPTYTQPLNDGGLYGNVSSIVDYGNEVILLLKDTEGQASYSLQRFSKNGHGARKKVALDPNKDYSLTKYQGKLLAYDTALSDLEIVEPGQSSISVSKLKVDNKTDLEPRSLLVSNGRISALYSNASTDSNQNSFASKTRLSTGKSVLYVYDNSTKNTYSFKTTFSKGVVCGQSLCLLSPLGLEVYKEEAGRRVTEQYTVPGVRDIIQTRAGTRYVTDNGLVVLDAEKGSGYVEYSFGTYRYCGAGASDSGYLLCLIDDKLGKIAVNIDSKAVNNKDSIDKKAYRLAHNEAVDYVSVNHSTIYVIPNYADGLSFAQTKKPYTKSHVADINKRVESAIAAQNIDRNIYTVVVAAR